MSLGGYISGIGHIGLLGWLALGAGFEDAPEPLEITPVSVISSEDFAILANNTPPVTPVVDVSLPSPDVILDQPEVNPVQDTDPDLQPAQETETPENDTMPETRPTALAVPEDVQTAIPQFDPAPLVIDDAVTLEATLQPARRPNDRVAPEAVLPPPLDVDIGDIQKDAVAPEPDAASPNPEPETNAEAPEAADTEIVTEAEAEPEAVVSAAPKRSLRPIARPQELASVQAPDVAEPEPEPVADPVAAALAAALAEAQEQSEQLVQSDVETGPSLSGQDIAGLQLAISDCWNVGSLSSEALATVIVIGFDLTQDGRPVNNSIRLVERSGGSAASADQAFEAARRAILICGAKGFELPSDKYEAWSTLEIVFNPENMRVK